MATPKTSLQVSPTPNYARYIQCKSRFVLKNRIRLIKSEGQICFCQVAGHYLNLNLGQWTEEQNNGTASPTPHPSKFALEKLAPYRAARTRVVSQILSDHGGDIHALRVLLEAAVVHDMIHKALMVRMYAVHEILQEERQ